MSFHVFIRERVDAAIYEVGIGGELDSTNVIQRPVVTGITSLGIDHTLTLGNSIEEIAWHKAGIFKQGRPAFSVGQYPAAAHVLMQRANERGVHLRTVGIHPGVWKVNLSPNADFQRKNASLAMSLAGTVLVACGIALFTENESLPDNVVGSLEKMTWPGRCQIKIKGEKEWCIDGAHTHDSMIVAGKWFAGLTVTKPLTRVLIFNQQSQRDAISLLKTLHDEVCTKGKIRFEHVIFCTHVTYETKGYKVDLMDNNADPSAVLSQEIQNSFADLWRGLDGGTDVSVVFSIEEAVTYAGSLGDGTKESRILVTGSLHLAGGVLFSLDGEDTE